MAKRTTGQRILAAVKASFVPPVPPAHVRWVIKRDVPDCLALAPSYSEAQMLDDLRDRHTIGMVATYGEAITGFVIYRLEERCLRVMRVAFGAGELGRSAREWLLGAILRKWVGHRRDYVALSYSAAVPLAGVEPAGETGSRYATFGPALAAIGVQELPVVDPSWLTTDVVALAGVDPHPPLPILADALQDAGCADEALLGAFRAGGPVAARVFAGLRGALRGG